MKTHGSVRIKGDDIMVVRMATINDIDGIAHVHVESWKTTYKGIISDAYLSNISINDRKARWERRFSKLTSDEIIYVIEEDEHILGFLHGGKNREIVNEFETEIYALYLLEEAQGKGYGRQLINHFIKYMKSRSYHTMMVWALEKNASIHFYRRLGGQIIKSQQLKIGDEMFTEVALGWEDVNNVGLEGIDIDGCSS